MPEAVGVAGPVSAGVGNGAPADWRAGLPEDLRGAPALEKFKDQASAHKAYIELEKWSGSAIRLPKEDAPDEEWDANVFGRLAAKSPEDYKLPDLAEGQTIDEEMVTWFKKAAFESKAPPRVAARLYAKYHEMLGARMADYKAEEEKGRAALKEEWGSDYEVNLALANKAGSEEFKKLLHSVGLNSHPVVLKELAAIGASRRPDSGLVDRPVAGGAGSKAAIQAKIDEMRKPEHPYMNPRAGYREHEAAVEEMDRLMRALSSA